VCYLPPDYKYKDCDWVSRQTWIIWHKRSPSGTIDLIWNPTTIDKDSHVAVEETMGYGQRYPIDLGRRHKLRFPTSQTEPTQELYFESDLPRYPLLQFWTLVIPLLILNINPEYYPRAYIYDCHYTYCGTLFLDSLEDMERALENQPLEFALLSERWSETNRRLWDWREKALEFGSEPYVDQENLYYVMLIQWRGGIAERKGLGSIWQKAVERSLPPGPKWKEIILG
jgi:hypothetical protein